MNRTFIFFGFIIALTACSGNAEKKPHTSGKTTDTIAEKPLVKDPDAFAPFVLVSTSYNENTRQSFLEILKFNQTLTPEKFSINITKKEGYLSTGAYNAAAAYYPVQFDSTVTKIYFSITDANEMEGEFNSQKIFEYNAITKKQREIISWNDYEYNWYYSEKGNRIYWPDDSSSAIKSIDLETGKTDTLFSFSKDSADASTFIEFIALPSGKFHVLFFYAKHYATLLVDPVANTCIKQDLFMKQDRFGYDDKHFPAATQANFTGYLFYKNQKVLSTFGDFKKDVNKLKIYTEKGNRDIDFKFKNFATYWVNAKEFVVIAENRLVLFNDDFEELQSFSKPHIHIIDCLQNRLLVMWWDESPAQSHLGLLDFGLNHLEEIVGIKPQQVISAKNITAK